MPSSNCVGKTLIGLGVTELIIGFGVFCCGIVGFAVKSRLYEYGHGLWGGSLFMLIGVLAIVGGMKKARCVHMAHMIIVIVTLIFVYPGLNMLFMSELTHDAFYNYHEDPDFCKQGCSLDIELGTYYNEDSFNSGSYKSYLESASPHCDSFIWTKTCSPNATAAKAEFSAMLLLWVIFIFCIVSACFTCCTLCRCCGVRDESIKPMYPYPHDDGYNDPYGGAVGGYGGYNEPAWQTRPMIKHQPLFPDGEIETGAGAPTNYMDEVDLNDTEMPAPAQAGKVNKLQAVGMAVAHQKKNSLMSGIVVDVPKTSTSSAPEF